MEDWRVLVTLEYEYRAFRLYRNIVYWLIKNGMKLSSPVLCYLNRKLDQHAIAIPGLKNLYERQTGRIIVFYKCDN
jgi:hypothetical protein